MFYNPNLSYLENMDNTINLAYVLCIICIAVIIISHITAKTEEKKREANAMTPLGLFVIMLFWLSVALLYPALKKNLNTSVEVATKENEKISIATKYESLTSKGDCRICSENSNDLISYYWGENNVAILDLNTFDFYRLEINRYDDQKKIIEKKPDI